jgi:hypothetical protein
MKKASPHRYGQLISYADKDLIQKVGGFKNTQRYLSILMTAYIAYNCRPHAYKYSFNVLMFYAGEDLHTALVKKDSAQG